jgi:hypothetical protein
MRMDPVRLAATALVLVGCAGEIGGESRERSPSATADLGDEAADVPSQRDAKEGGKAVEGLPGTGPAPVLALTSTRIWRLTPAQYAATVEQALGTEVDLSDLAVVERHEGFLNEESGLRVDGPFLLALEETARRIATAHFGRITGQLRCPLEALNRSCLEAFVRSFGAKVFRVTAFDPEPYVALYEKLHPQIGQRDALEDVVVAMLLAPKALFRTELGHQTSPGKGRVPLTAAELAENLAYTLWNRPPDAELMARAADGSLLRPEVLRAQFNRLVEAPRWGEAGLIEFLVQWLGLATFAGVEKSPALFPQFTPELKRSMLAETTQFLAYVLSAKGARFSELLTLAESFPDEALAQTIYGSSKGPRLSAATPVALDPAQRAGVFTHASVLSAISGPAATGVIYRGKYILEKLLCIHLPEPPDDLPMLEDLPKELTTRQRLQSFEGTAPCGACHRLLHPPALALETYDAIGRYRPSESGKLIDASGALSYTETASKLFRNAVEMFGILAESTEVHECFARQAFRYVYGRSEKEGDIALWKGAYERFQASGLSLRAIMEPLVLSEAFTHRERR